MMKRHFLLWLLVFSFPYVAGAVITVESVIEHGLYSSWGISNVTDVSYDATRNRLYLAHGYEVGYIHTIDMDGNLLNSWQLTGNAPYTYPLSLDYDSATDTLFMTQREHGSGINDRYIRQTSIDGTITYNTYDINAYGVARGIHVDDNGLWLASFWQTTIHHLSTSGVLIDQLHGHWLYPNIPCYDITASFDGGFFLLTRGQPTRIIEIDAVGNYLGEVSLDGLYPGWYGASGIDIDPANNLVYVQDDDFVYVLSGVAESMRYVPEPCSLVLLGVGALAMFRSRQSQRGI